MEPRILPDLEIRSVDTTTRQFTGIAVPFDEEIDLGFSVRESVAPGAVDDEGALVFWRHREPIGKITAATDTAQGRQISGKLSATPLGEEAYTLLRDGVITKLSIGFDPIEHIETKNDDGTITIRHTKIKVREVSLVPHPAYESAEITQIRHRQPVQKEAPKMETQTTEITELRAAVDEIGRRLEVELPALRADKSPTGPKLTYQSAGAMLRALASGDAAAIQEYEAGIQHVRDFTGGVIADAAPRNTWLGDLTRWFEESSILLNQFSTGVLPAEGMTLEFAQDTSSTITVTDQTNEGDSLPVGKITLGLSTVPVTTFGGAATISKQAAQRAQISYLDSTLRRLAQAAVKHRNAKFRATYSAILSANIAAEHIVESESDLSTWEEWIDVIIDAADIFEDNGLTIDSLIVPKATFKQLAKLSASDDLMFKFDTSGAHLGTLSPRGLTGSLASIPVVVNPKAASTDVPAFVSKQAVRVLSSPVASLTDQDIISLTNAYSIYGYQAVVPEAPEGILPIVATLDDGIGQS